MAICFLFVLSIPWSFPPLFLSYFKLIIFYDSILYSLLCLRALILPCFILVVALGFIVLISLAYYNLTSWHHAILCIIQEPYNNILPCPFPCFVLWLSYIFIFIYCAWGSPIFFNLWVDSFQQLEEIIAFLFSNVHSASFFSLWLGFTLNIK